MGVMPCSRTGCDNILCDRLSNEWGYICDDCFDEMVATQVMDIGAFLGIPPKWIPLNREFYEKIFPTI